MPSASQIIAGSSHQGRVLQVLATADPKHFRTSVRQNLTVALQGIPDDRHFGFTRPAGPREKWYPAGMQIRSGRQLTLVSAEELAEVARRMDIPRIEAGWIGANILLEDVADFTNIPCGTRLFFEDGAVLVNEGVNVPCRFAGQEIARQFPGRDDLALLFVSAAKHLRGIVASVEQIGSIAPGPVRLKIPDQKIWTGGTLL